MQQSSHHPLSDLNQSSWQLTVIQLAGWLSLPIIATSILVLNQNSFWSAVMTLIVGNAILWFIRLGIVLMSHDRRESTLDLTRSYLGVFGSYFISVLLLISGLAWFIVQTTAAGSALTHLIAFEDNQNIDRFTQMSVFLGITSSFLCMEGMSLLRRLATVAFPILLASFFVLFFTLPEGNSIAKTSSISLSGLGIVLATNLGVSADLPTFFRHSKSLYTSVKALISIQLVSLILGLLSLYFGSLIIEGFEVNLSLLMSGSVLFRISSIVFIFLSVICANVAIVYAASVGWEVLAPAAFVGRKEYLILGLSLTTIFILVSNLISAEYLLEMSETSLVNLSVVFILGYLVAQRNKRLPDFYERTTYFSAWLISTTFDILEISHFFNWL
jgi:purine-cytosine permease-like protein